MAQPQRECCLLVLNLVSSTLPCIRQPQARMTQQAQMAQPQMARQAQMPQPSAQANRGARMVHGPGTAVGADHHVAWFVRGSFMLYCFR